MRASCRHWVVQVRHVCNRSQRLAMVGLLALSAAAAAARAADAPAPAPAGAAPPASQPANAPKIEFDKTNVDFPEVWAGDKIEHTYIVKNTGSGTLEITRVTPGCGCTVAGDWDKKIEPGKSGKIPIAINSQHLRGEVTKQITVESNDPTNPRTILVMKGKIKAAVDMQPVTGFSWAQITPQSPDKLTVTLTNNLDTPWKLSLAQEPNQPMQANFDLAIKETEPGKKAEVTATLKKPLKEGSVYAQFKLLTGIEKSPEVLISANYFLPPALQVMPNPIYGLIVPGQEFRSVVSVSYNREGTLEKVTATPSDPAIKAEVTQPNPTDKKHYTVTVTLPRDYKIDTANPPRVDIQTDKADLPNKGTVSVAIAARPQSTQPYTPPPDPALQLVGKPAPSVKLKDTAGKDVTIGGKTGAVTILDFWATWCPHCRKQVPVVAGMMKTYGAKGVKLYSISVDAPRPPNPELTPAQIAEDAKRLGEDFPIVLDPKSEAFPKYGGGGIPMMFLVSKEGVIEAFHRGEGGPDFEKVLGKELDTLLEGKSLPRTPPPANPQQPTVAAIPQATGPSLYLDSLRQDIGQRKPGEVAQYSITLRNNGTEALQIKAIKANSESLTVDPQYPKTLAAGGTGIVKVEAKVPGKPGSFQNDLTIETNDARQATRTVSLTGITRPYIEIQPPQGITFPRNARVQDIPSLATIVYNGKEKIEYSKPESDSPKFEATIEPILNGPYAKLIVKTRPPLAPGDNKAIIHIKTNIKEQPSIDVPVLFYLPPAVEISPTEVLLSTTTYLQRPVVSIRNNSNKSLNILSVKSSNEKIRTQFFPEADGLSYRVMILVPPSDPAKGPPAAEKITIRTDDPEFSEIVIPIKFSAAADAQGAAH